MRGYVLLKNTNPFSAYVRWKDLEDDAVVPEKDYWIGEVKEIRGYDADDVSFCLNRTLN